MIERLREGHQILGHRQRATNINNRQKHGVAVIHWHFFDMIRLSIIFRKILDEGHFFKKG